jgi:putative spermidine/putrescine transport system permease protein
MPLPISPPHQKAFDSVLEYIEAWSRMGDKMSEHISVGSRLKVRGLAPRIYAWGREHPQVGAFLPMLPLLIYLSALFAYPLTRMIRLSFFDPEFSLEHYHHFFSVPVYFKVLVYTARISLLVTVLTLIIGYPVAYLLTIAPSNIRNILFITVLIPWWTSTLVRTYAWMVILGRNGLINQILLGLGLISSPLKLMYNTLGVVIGMLHVQLPLAILPLYSVMSGIDQELLKAAQSLGANALQTFRRIFFPLSMPGVTGAGLLVFVGSMGFYITPALLGGPSNVLISNLIDSQVSGLIHWGFGSAMSVILLFISFVFFFLYNRYLGLDRLLGGRLA